MGTEADLQRLVSLRHPDPHHLLGAHADADGLLIRAFRPEAAGVFNVGTGLARSWNDLARAMFSALQLPERISYIEMPDNLREQYQYHTRADVAKLRAAGYERDFCSLEKAVSDYVQGHLLLDKHLGA